MGAESRSGEWEAIFRAERSRVLATVIRLVGDYDRAEDALQEAFAVALAKWPQEGIPANPRAWLVSTARNKAIDALRRDAKVSASLTEDIAQTESEWDLDAGAIEDDRLRLLFICCHPALPTEGQVALTLRDVCGLTTEEIAKAFLSSGPTIAQRIVRTKAKIRAEGIPYTLPGADELPERLRVVMQVVYLLFNEGYYASSGRDLVRGGITEEAIRLGRMLAARFPKSDAVGLLAMMLLNESRAKARTGPDGEIVLLRDQDRSRWDECLIREGLDLAARAEARGEPGPYSLLASVAATHTHGALAGATDWDRVVGLYDRLLQVWPSAVVALNRAVAVSMRDGPYAGLALVDGILAEGELKGYGLAHATRADFLRQLGRWREAGEDYQRALALSTQDSERRFLEMRMREVAQSDEL